LFEDRVFKVIIARFWLVSQVLAIETFGHSLFGCLLCI